MKGMTIAWSSASILGLLFCGRMVPMALAQPCLDFYTTTEDGTVLTKVHRKTGDTTSVPLTKKRIYSLAYDTLTESLFGLLDGTKLVTIDEATGFVTVVGKTGRTDLMGLATTEYGEMFAFSNSDSCLYYFMLGREARQFVCTPFTDDIVGLAYARDKVYLTDGKELYAIDPWTQLPESLGKVSGLNDGARLAGLATSPNSGRLYGISNDPTKAGIYGIEEYTLTTTSSDSDRVFHVANRNARSDLTNVPNGGTLACKFQSQAGGGEEDDEEENLPSDMPSLVPSQQPSV